MKDDLISRQAAISHVDDVPYIKEHPNVGLLWKAWIESLPSAQPERRKGKWDFMGWQMFQCSECKHTFTQDFLEGWRGYTYEPFFPPFCPNCGADMRGEQDDESRSNSNAQTDTWLNSGQGISR